MNKHVYLVIVVTETNEHFQCLVEAWTLSDCMAQAQSDFTMPIHSMVAVRATIDNCNN